MPKEVLWVEENNYKFGSTEDSESVRNGKYLNKYIRLLKNPFLDFFERLLIFREKNHNIIRCIAHGAVNKNKT